MPLYYLDPTYASDVVYPIKSDVRLFSPALLGRGFG